MPALIIIAILGAAIAHQSGASSAGNPNKGAIATAHEKVMTLKK